MERSNPVIGNTIRRVDKDCIECGERFSQTVRKLDYAQGREPRERCDTCWMEKAAGLLEADDQEREV